MIDAKDSKNILKDKYKIKIGQPNMEEAPDIISGYDLKQVNLDEQLQISIPIDEKNVKKLKIMRYLKSKLNVKQVNYPGSLPNSPNGLLKGFSKNEIDVQELNIHKNSKQNLLQDQFFSHNQLGSISQRGLLNNGSAISSSQPFSFNENQLIQLDESSSEDDQTEIEKNLSRLKNVQDSTNRDSVDTNKVQKSLLQQCINRQCSQENQ